MPKLTNKQVKEYAGRDGHVLRRSMYQLIPLRVENELKLRVKQQVARECKKVGYPVPMAEVLRKCISLGLAQMERTK